MPDLPRWELLLADSRAAERRSQAESFPYDLDIDGMTIRVRAGVCSPRHFYGWRFYLPHLPSVSGQRVLEVGCGAGVAAIHFARTAAAVVACDIVPACVEATRENAALNGVTNLEAVDSDVFSGVHGRFDTIFWNIPWGFLPVDFPPAQLTPATLGNFSVGYATIARFLAGGPARMSPGGRLLVVVGERTAHWPLLGALLSPYTVEVLARGMPSGDGYEHLRLLSLRPA